MVTRVWSLFACGGVAGSRAGCRGQRTPCHWKSSEKICAHALLPSVLSTSPLFPPLSPDFMWLSSHPNQFIAGLDVDAQLREFRRGDLGGWWFLSCGWLLPILYHSLIWALNTSNMDKSAPLQCLFSYLYNKKLRSPLGRIFGARRQWALYRVLKLGPCHLGHNYSRNVFLTHYNRRLTRTYNSKKNLHAHTLAFISGILSRNNILGLTMLSYVSRSRR